MSKPKQANASRPGAAHLARRPLASELEDAGVAADLVERADWMERQLRILLIANDIRAKQRQSLEEIARGWGLEDPGPGWLDLPWQAGDRDGWDHRRQG